MLKIVTVVGARPQFIKAGPVSRAIAARNDLTEVLVHTGQHFDDAMSAVFFRELELPEPRYNLGIASLPQGAMTGRMIEAIEEVLVREKPGILLVYGDTNSTIAGALAAAKLHIPVGHIEAGLRSFNRRMPEEINRVVTDHLAAIQFCPTRAAVHNLAAEGITRDVYHTGDVMYDATLFAIERNGGDKGLLETLGVESGGYDVCTLHRAENTDDSEQLRKVVEYLRQHASARQLIMPLHPRTHAAISREGLDLSPVRVIDPLGYFELHKLLAGAEMVLTDSGGLQKEAYFHGKRCVTLRDETEWVETIDHGWNRLWRVSDYEEPRRPIEDYGQGKAAETIIDLLADLTG